MSRRVRLAGGKPRGFKTNLSSKDRRRRKASLVASGGGKCANCGKGGKLTIDHITPLASGGSNKLTNLRLLCPSCNQAKRDKAYLR